MPHLLPASFGGAPAPEIPQRFDRARPRPMPDYSYPHPSAPVAATSANPNPNPSHHRKPMAQRKHKGYDPEQCRDGVDPHDLSRRLYSVMAKRGQLGTWAYVKSTAMLPAEPPKHMDMSRPAPVPVSLPATATATAAAANRPTAKPVSKVPAKPTGPYVPSEAASQFARTTTAPISAPRMSIRLVPQTSSIPLSGSSHEARETRETRETTDGQSAPKQPSFSPSTSLRHAYKDANTMPDKKMAMVYGCDHVQVAGDEEAADSTDMNSKPMQPAEYIRLAHEHTVDWTQADAMRAQREQAERDEQEAKREAEKEAEMVAEKEAKKREADRKEAEGKLTETKAAEKAAETKEAEKKKKSRLHRLKARLSTFSFPAEPKSTAATRSAAKPEKSRAAAPTADEDVPALTSSTASSPPSSAGLSSQPSSTGLSLTTSATLAQQSLEGPSRKLANMRSADRFMSMFRS